MDSLILSDFNNDANLQTVKTTLATNAIKLTALKSIVKLILLFAVGVIAWISWKPGLYDQYKISTDVIALQLAQTPNSAFKEAAAHLNEGNYYEARQILSKYYLNDLSNISLAKQYATILIASDCFDTSKQVLYPVFDSKNASYKAEAAYLLGLAFLKEGRYLSSQQWLAKVSSGSIYYIQAQELISKMEQLKTN